MLPQAEAIADGYGDVALPVFTAQDQRRIGLMGWTYDRSKERVEQHLQNLGTIEIEKLKREANLEELLTETRCRKIYGAHVYATVSNFARLASENADTERYRKLIQAVHVFQREVNRIVEDPKGINGLSIHFQGEKLHALLYRPIDDGRVLATRAAVLQLVLRDFVKEVFNPAFPNFDNFSISAGADIGDVIGTRNGTKGDRELLFLGAPANYAAKIIRGNGFLRITSRIYNLLPDVLKQVAVKVGDGADYRLIQLTRDDLDELLDDLADEGSDFDVTWDREASAGRVREDKHRVPLKDIEYSEANDLIDMDALSVRNNKRVNAASVFADVSGFTAFIEAATTPQAQRGALRVFHAIRQEMSCVVRDDYPGVRVQYQGDRVQAIYHLPKNDAGKMADDAVTAGAAIQSSLETVIKELLPEAAPLSMAVGVDYGVTLVSKLGTRGQRDRICLGEPVDGAAAAEEAAQGGEIAVSSEVYDALPRSLAGFFQWEDGRQLYIGTGVTAERVARARRAMAAQGSAASEASRFLRTTERGTTVGSAAAASTRTVPDEKPHARTKE